MGIAVVFHEIDDDASALDGLSGIIDDFAGEKLDYWVTGFGTGGTLKGVARVLARERPETKIIVCEPADAPMLASGGPQERKPDGSPAAAHAAWKPHPMQGWSPDFIPKLTGDAVDMKMIHQLIGVAGSLRKTMAMKPPNRTLVSCSAATSAMGATVMAQMTIQ